MGWSYPDLEGILMGVCTVSGGLTESVECAICDWLYVAVLAEVDIPHRVYYVIVLRHVYQHYTGSGTSFVHVGQGAYRGQVITCCQRYFTEFKFWPHPTTTDKPRTQPHDGLR